MKTIKNKLRVKNSYTDQDERVSFSIQAVACDNETETCADPGAVEKFFEDVYFTAYILKENIAFGEKSNIGKRPVSVNDQFHSQFMLNPGQYRDCNNFVEFNKVTTSDNKWSLLSKKQEFGFLNFKQLPYWTSKAFKEKELVSTDGGKTEIETNDSLLLGIYFFVDDYRVESSRQVYTFVQLLAETGGIANALIGGLGIFVGFYNYYVGVMHFIHLLYFVRDEKETDSSGLLSKSGKQ